MKLRTLILAVSLGVGILFGTFALFEASRFLKWGFQELNATYVNDLTEIARASLETKKSALRSFGKTLGLNFNLAGIYVVARESKDPKMIAHSLKSVQARSGFDIVDIFDDKGNPSIAHGFTIDPARFKEVVAKEDKLVVLTLYDELTLVGFFPLNLYGQPVGYVMLGYYLNRAVAKELGSSRASLHFDYEPQGTQSYVIPSLVSIEGRPVALSLQIQKDFLSEVKSLLARNLALFAALCFVVLIVLIFLGLHFGFVGKFQAYLKKIDLASQELAQGKIPSIPQAEKENITELNQLARSFEHFATSIATYDARVKEQIRLAAEAQKKAALSELAQEVAHNIRSPLSALDMLVTATDAIPAERRLLIQGAMQRVHDLANRVLDAHRAPSALATIPLDGLLESLTEEKKFQWQSRPQLRLQLLGANSKAPRFVRADGAELKAMVSNLLNNAAEAIVGDGKITVEISDAAHEITLVVRDNGCGIAPERLAKLGEKGATFGKSDGSGIGLYHALNTARAAGGSLAIESTLGQGTQISVTLPRVETPGWFVSSIEVPDTGCIAALDDDPFFLEAWKKKFPEAFTTGRFHVFSSATACLQWATENQTPIELFLSDFDLGEIRNGVDVIQILRKAGKLRDAIVVTARYEDAQLAEQCADLGIRLFPKNLLFNA